MHQTARRILLAATALLSLATPALADSGNLTVVELFQSQGCSSCPPANANVMALNGRPDLLTLSFGVTYWDHLGWKDTFAKPQYTDRQWDYAHAFHRGPGVYAAKSWSMAAPMSSGRTAKNWKL